MAEQVKKRRWWLWILVGAVGLPVGGLALLVALLLVAGPVMDAMGVPEAGETPTAQEQETDHWEQALDSGMAAAEGAQGAQSFDEWKAVEEGWSEAIAFLKMIEEGEPQYAEAQAKIADYQANRDAATQRKAAAPKPKTELDVAVEAVEAFEVTLRSADPERALFGDVRLDDMDDDFGMVTVVVKDPWHYQPKTVREEAARNLWTGWATLRQMEEADYARLRLETPNGKHVGGSRALAGSLIWVED